MEGRHKQLSAGIVGQKGGRGAEKSAFGRFYTEEFDLTSTRNDANSISKGSFIVRAPPTERPTHRETHLMLIQVNYSDVIKTDAIQRFVEEKLAHELEYVADQVTRVEVHLHDDKAGRHGDHDKRCVMEARPTGLHPVAVEYASANLNHSITEAIHKLGRLVKKTLDRRHDHGH